MSKQRGFTLVELLVVLVIMGLLMTLVGSLTVEQVDKARAQEEWLVLQRTLGGVAFRAYARNEPVEVLGDGRRLDWKAASGQSGELTLEQLSFDAPQKIVFNASGIANPARLEVRQRGRLRSIELNAWLEDRA
jgi:prepilin-type N-terminal cleavage/methylation domain-containing protein